MGLDKTAEWSSGKRRRHVRGERADEVSNAGDAMIWTGMQRRECGMQSSHGTSGSGANMERELRAEDDIFCPDLMLYVIPV